MYRGGVVVRIHVSQAEDLVSNPIYEIATDVKVATSFGMEVKPVVPRWTSQGLKISLTKIKKSKNIFQVK